MAFDSHSFSTAAFSTSAFEFSTTPVPVPASTGGGGGGIYYGRGGKKRRNRTHELFERIESSLREAFEPEAIPEPVVLREKVEKLETLARDDSDLEERLRVLKDKLRLYLDVLEDDDEFMLMH